MTISNDICIFDLETTGLDKMKDRICQIAIKKIKTDATTEFCKILINPEMPIPAEATEIHGITDEMVKDAPTFKMAAPEIYEYLHGCDLSGFNSDEFDIPLLTIEMKRAEIIFPDPDSPPSYVDVKRLHQKVYPNTLSALLKFYTGEDHINAHDAGGDVIATEMVLSHILERHFDKTVTPAELEKFISGGKQRYDVAGKLYQREDGVICFAFGNHQDKPVLDQLGYIDWMLGKDFPEETKKKLRELVAK